MGFFFDDLGSDVVRGSQQTVEAVVVPVGERAMEGKDFDKECDGVGIVDVRDETSPRKLAAVEGKD